MASRDLQTDSYPFVSVYHDVEFRKSAVEGNVLGNEVGLCSGYFTDVVVSCACHDLRESPPRPCEILFCFRNSLRDVFVVT